MPYPEPSDAEPRPRRSTRTRWDRASRIFCCTASVLSLVAGCGKPTTTESVPETNRLPEKATAPEGPAKPAELRRQNPSSAIELEVNDHSVTRAQLDGAVEREIGMLKRQMPPAQYKELAAKSRNKAVAGYIELFLLNDAAEAAGVEISEAQLKEEFARQRQRFPKDLTFEKARALPDVKQSLEAQLRINQYLSDQLRGQLDVTDEELETFKKSIAKEMAGLPQTARIRHIHIRTSPNDPEATKAVKRKLIDEIHGRLSTGEDFARLAREHSDCPSAVAGGQLGVIKRGALLPALDTVIFSINAGQLSPVVTSPQGYHIIEVQERTAAGSLPETQLRAKLEEKKRREAVRAVVEELKAKAVIKTHQGS